LFITLVLMLQDFVLWSILDDVYCTCPGFDLLHCYNAPKIVLLHCLKCPGYDAPILPLGLHICVLYVSVSDNLGYFIDTY